MQPGGSMASAEPYGWRLVSFDRDFAWFDGLERLALPEHRREQQFRSRSYTAYLPLENLKLQTHVTETAQRSGFGDDDWSHCSRVLVLALAAVKWIAGMHRRPRWAIKMTTPISATRATRASVSTAMSSGRPVSAWISQR